jgi:hypothetical protein
MTSSAATRIISELVAWNIVPCTTYTLNEITFYWFNTRGAHLNEYTCDWGKQLDVGAIKSDSVHARHAKGMHALLPRHIE